MYNFRIRYVWDALNKLNLINQYSIQNHRYILSGHSLGGALATLLAVQVNETGTPVPIAFFAYNDLGQIFFY